MASAAFSFLVFADQSSAAAVALGDKAADGEADAEGEDDGETDGAALTHEAADGVLSASGPHPASRAAKARAGARTT
ncbi:hypothetical protein Ate02nite_62580 [Paractinoplanes tereljensis]|uniref:Uncharacterized protein n=1 Tax=Paractinoplanes tereljensis TaxID=571912 RepID=A0A919NRT2_9ACTN|nr:hypothetical protein Ate02nite_62580 [Actinoplanes tereljensis]